MFVSRQPHATMPCKNGGLPHDSLRSGVCTPESAPDRLPIQPAVAAAATLPELPAFPGAASWLLANAGAPPCAPARVGDRGVCRPTRPAWKGYSRMRSPFDAEQPMGPGCLKREGGSRAVKRGRSVLSGRYEVY